MENSAQPDPKLLPFRPKDSALPGVKSCQGSELYPAQPKSTGRIEYCALPGTKLCLVQP
jgi:hypothetical protein